MPSRETYDCIIIGGGPAGLTCAIFLGRYRLRVLLVDNDKPRNYASRGIHGFLGQHGIEPGELRRRGRAEAEEAGVEVCECTAETIERVGDVFEVVTSSGPMRARRIALAYGVRDILPDIPELERYYGASVFHCPDCDGYEVTGKRVGVIGRGQAVVGLALKLLQWASEVTIFLHGGDRDFSKEETSKMLAEKVAVKDERVIQLDGDGEHLRAAVLSTGERVELEALFFSGGVEPSSDLAEKLGCTPEKDTPCCLKVSGSKETSVKGVFAMGDIVAGSQLAITAAADGAIAAIAINRSLLPPSRVV